MSTLTKQPKAKAPVDPAKRRRTNKRILTGAGFVAVFCIGLAAGGAGGDEATSVPSPAPSASAAPSAQAGALRSTMDFTSAVRAAAPGHDEDRAKILTRGLDACTAIASGSDPVAAVTPRFIMTDGSQPSQEQAQAIAAALKGVC